MIGYRTEGTKPMRYFLLAPFIVLALSGCFGPDYGTPQTVTYVTPQTTTYGAPAATTTTVTRQYMQ
jgi:hypothetical protein